MQNYYYQVLIDGKVFPFIIEWVEKKETKNELKRTDERHT